MRVISKGRKQEGWAHRGVCTGAGNGGGGCGAELMVEQADAYQTRTHNRDELTAYATFMCIACGVETDDPTMPSKAHELPLLGSHQREARRRNILDALKREAGPMCLYCSRCGWSDTTKGMQEPIDPVHCPQCNNITTYMPLSHAARAEQKFTMAPLAPKKKP